MRELIFSAHGDQIVEKVISVIIDAAREKVPNIREVCVKTERDIAMKTDNKTVRETIKKHLQAMVEDNDF